MTAFLNAYVPAYVLLIVGLVGPVAGWVVGGWWTNQLYRRAIKAALKAIPYAGTGNDLTSGEFAED